MRDKKCYDYIEDGKRFFVLRKLKDIIQEMVLELGFEGWIQFQLEMIMWMIFLGRRNSMGKDI